MDWLYGSVRSSGQLSKRTKTVMVFLRRVGFTGFISKVGLLIMRHRVDGLTALERQSARGHPGR